MHIAYKDSLGIEDLFEVSEFDSPEELDKQSGKPGTCVLLANMYIGQKSALVKQRRALRAKVHELTKFAHDPTKQVKKEVEEKGTDGVVRKVTRMENKETEGDFFARLKTAVLAKKFTHDLLPNGTEQAFDAGLKKIARSLGVFVYDAKEAERTAKEKLPPAYASNAAKNIIANGSQAKWVKTFADEKVPHEDFTTKPPKGASPDEVAATHALNEKRLAWAIKAREDMRSKAEYV